MKNRIKRIRRRAVAAIGVGSALVAVALPAIGAAGSDPPDLVTLEIEAPADLERFAARLRDWRPERLSNFARLLGLELEASDLPIPVRVVLAPEGSAAELGAPRWVAGYVRSDSGVVVLFPTRVPRYPYRTLEELLGHEVAHLLTFRASAGRPLPRWFHEGLSMLAEEAWGIEDRSRVALALLRHGRSSLADLEAGFNDPARVARAYALAGAFVRDVVNREGRDFPARLLVRVADGEPFDSAFAAAAGRSLEAAESSFWRRFTFWYRWLPFFTSSTTLWMAIVLLALVAIRRRRQRDRALKEKWELEDGPLEPIN